MWDKKGDWALPLYILQSLALLVIILFIFSILFFTVGIKQNPELRINPEHYQDSSKLLIILRSQTNVNHLTIAELITLAANDDSYKDELEAEIRSLLLKIPPQITSDWNWVLKIKVDNQVFLESGITAPLRKEYLHQSATIPLQNKKTAKLTMYFECFACSGSEINAAS